MAELKNITEAKDAPREGSASRSGIASPYFDLMASIAVAEAVFKIWGGVCSPDQLATSLGYKSTSSGTYMTRLAAANKHFGLVEVNGDRISITERAKKILAPVMPDDVINAKVESFLAVALFSRVYEQFKGSTLPPEVGIKNLFLNSYAILPDRLSQAMRVFYNSAEQAGFFSATGDRTRLVRPSSVVTQAPPPQTTDSAGKKHVEAPPPSTAHDRIARGGGGGDGGTGGVHSAIIGLLRDLPPPGSDWPKKQKARFVKAFQATLDFVYPTDEDDDAASGGTS